MASQSELLLKRPLYVYDLPPRLLETLERQTESSVTSTSIEADENDRNLGHASIAEETEDQTRSISCTLCGLAFANVQDQRSHARSDVHGYNLKQKMRGLPPVSDVEFEKLVGELDESISGSESSNSDSDSGSETQANTGKMQSKLSTLLERQANISEPVEDVANTKKRKRGAGKPPLLWFKSTLLTKNTSLGVYRAVFSTSELQDEASIVQTIRDKQLSPRPPPRQDDEGGVPLPQVIQSPHIFLCMMGGGHFAGMVVSLAPKVGKRQGLDERQASVLAHKTFHRYTTRRKQGGGQAANDSSKGAAHSAGSSLRRYNEAALTDEVRELLSEWKSMIDSSELLFIRATGKTNRQTLFGQYDGQVLHHNDDRIRGFPFSTRRATQAELMRCFVELTRVKVSQVDEAALAAQQAKQAAEADERAAAAERAKQSKAAKAATKEVDPVEEAKLMHTGQIEALVRRSKAPALLTYLKSNSVSPDFLLHPQDSHAHHHAPTALHLAASSASPPLVSALLVKAGADPSIRNAQGKTAFEMAGDRQTRDAFRLARAELGEEKWAWDSAGVPEPLTRSDFEARLARERAESEAQESSRRERELERIREEEKKREEERIRSADEKRESKMGKGRTVGTAKEKTAEEKREEEGRGMSEEMKRKMERERRARAAEERMRRAANGSGT